MNARSLRDQPPHMQAERALRAAARNAGRPTWAWSYCQVYTTVTGTELGGGPSYNVCIDVNGNPYALLDLEASGGKPYSAWWRPDFTSDPWFLGHFDDADTALADVEKLIADVASGARKLADLPKNPS
ncbi:hypothetical protein [Microbispora sp. NPDC049125]|uniref:hypothetical protein n=1 Tax=Microbispora sp. NPDC049125 TaxID=3154929 RepID=UPI0034660AD4